MTELKFSYLECVFFCLLSVYLKHLERHLSFLTKVFGSRFLLSKKEVNLYSYFVFVLNKF